MKRSVTDQTGVSLTGDWLLKNQNIGRQHLENNGT